MDDTLKLPLLKSSFKLLVEQLGENDKVSIAKKNFIQGGNNRVILATDGDFNVGVSSEIELVKLIE